MKDQFDLQNNLTTHAKIMIRDNKDLTIDQAQLIIDDNKSVNGIQETPNETQDRG